MRETLKQIGSGERHTFVGVFERTGYKTEQDRLGHKHYHPTLLLLDVKTLSGEPVTGHLWFNYTKAFQGLGQLRQGDLIQFDARVDVYYKGYHTEQKIRDYKLARPTKIGFLHDDKVRLEVPSVPAALIGYIMQANEPFYVASGRIVGLYYVRAYKAWQKDGGVDVDPMKLAQEIV